MRLAPSRHPLLAALLVTACHHENGALPPDSQSPPDAPTGCAEGHAGAACVIALYDAATAACDGELVAKLVGELDARKNIGPLWANGRALFRTAQPSAIAGTFNAWSTTALETKTVCGSSLVAAVGAVATGFHEYKLVSGSTWSLDADNPAFAFDDFSGNADGKNSVLNTPDSGRGHLVALDRACSTALGNCRNVTAYLPRGYNGTDVKSYPVLFMHDGQNVWDDHRCCFGFGGWEVNVTLDTEIAAGRVGEAIVIGADNTSNRTDEYGLSAATTTAFMQFQVTELQPQALAHVRGNGRLLVAGSSLGGLVSMELALRYPQTYAGAASLSGSFWVGQDDGTAVRDQLPAIGKQPLALYLDSGGSLATNADSAADTAEVRDLLVGLGWQRADSPSCISGPNAVCYFIAADATHDEAAWRARTWRFLQFLLPP
jgi:enterochelin esterase-like enzyme